jgi:YVTN family beta-propeller protein
MPTTSVRPPTRQVSIATGILLVTALLAAPAGTALAGATNGAAHAKALAAPAAGATAKDILLVGNSVDGTVSLIDESSWTNLGSINVIPDLAERLAGMTLIEKIEYGIVKGQEGGDRFVDDAFVSPDGRTMYVSRGNLADVVSLDLTTRKINWRFHVSGIHADHMALSPDGSRVVVSATTAGEAQVLNAATGALIGAFPTGSYPHANDYSPDGKRIYNSSIGTVSLPKSLELLKGSRQLTVVDATTLKVVRTYQFDHGIRPAVFASDERTMYAQLSYLNGFVEYDLTAGKITRTVQMPFSTAGAALKPDDYPNNSAHHGMAMSGDGNKLCVAGTIDDYVAIISRPALTTDRIVTVGKLPYWATTSSDGKSCLVSNSKDNTVSVVSYATGAEITRIPVGTFPQRERTARIPVDVLASLT